MSARSGLERNNRLLGCQAHKSAVNLFQIRSKLVWRVVKRLASASSVCVIPRLAH